jgi:hypothetical protein
MRIFVSSVAAIFLCSSAIAQQSSDKTASLVRQAMTKNVLTTPSSPPFHAILDIQPDPNGPPTQQARVELFWAAPEHYALDIRSPDFTQHLVVDETRISETDHGDYYPAWLHYFVLALFNPVDRAAEVLAHPNSFHDQPIFANTCYEWDSRDNNLTDAERDAQICFAKPLMQLAYTLDYMRFVELSGFQPFHDKSIARQYVATLSAIGSMPHGTLSVLEDWQPDPSLLHVTVPTTTPRLIFQTQTAPEATASIVSKPENVTWPTTREGALSGKVLVHVVTDRTGKVRETSAPESNNEELKSFASDLAKQYVFRPLLLNGEAVQVEMPLIISFNLGEQKPYRKFNDAETRARVKGCILPKEISDPASAGQVISIEMLLVEDGHIGQIGSSDRHIMPPALYGQFHDCHFDPYLEDGKRAVFRAAFNVLAK